MDPTQPYTAIIIGSGPAGHTCAVRLAQLGARVAIVERDFLGGICTNWGCTPSKSMIESAKIARVVQDSAHYGVAVSDFQIDFARVAARRNQVIADARAEVAHLLAAHRVDVYCGEAELLAPGEVRVRAGALDPDGEHMHYTGEEQTLRADHVVLSTGSHPLIPGFVRKEDPSVVSSNRLITIEERPEELTIVGGGVIGLEFATIFSNLGSQVRVVEYLDRVLATLDPAISAEITCQMETRGVEILTGHEVQKIEHGVLMAKNRATGAVHTIPAPLTLISIGREANVDPASFDRLGLQYTRKGIGVDDYLRTNLPRVWAIGDATGKSILAHVGIQQGIVCAENIAREEMTPLRAMDYSVVPAVVYSIPEVVSVGQAPADDPAVQSFTVPFSANLRARIEDYTDGFLKLWVRDGVMVAAQAVGYGVSEIIQQMANAVALKTPLEDLAGIIHAHPTYTEITRTAALFALGKAVDYVPTPAGPGH